MAAKSAKPTFSADDLIVRREHMMLALNLSAQALMGWQLRGRIPPHDGSDGCLKLWKIATIRAWNPAVADAIEQILAIPACAPRPPRTAHSPLLAA